MLMIVGYHFFCHGVQLGGVKEITGNFLFGLFYYGFFMLHVDSFVLISGYFLSAADMTTPALAKKTAKLWSVAFFYSAGIMLLAVSSGLEPFGWKKLLFSFMPFKWNDYWFLNAYIVIFLLHPFINRIIRGLGQKQYQHLLGILLLLGSIYSVGKDAFYFGRGFSPAWFLTLYLTAGYIRRYGLSFRRRTFFIIYITCGLLNMLTLYLFSKYFGNLGASYKGVISGGDFLSYNAPLVFLSAVSLFCLLKDVSIENAALKKILHWLVPSVFGVYLIHDNNWMRPVLWNQIVQAKEVFRSDFFIIKFIAVVGLVFFVCICVDKIRMLVFSILETLWRKIWRKSRISIGKW